MTTMMRMLLCGALLLTANAAAAQTLSCATDQVPLQTDDLFLDGCAEALSVRCEGTHTVTYDGKWHYEWTLWRGGQVVDTELETLTCDGGGFPCQLPWVTFDDIRATGPLHLTLRVWRPIIFFWVQTAFNGVGNELTIHGPDAVGTQIFDAHPAAILGDGAGVHKYPPLIGDFNRDDRSDIAFVGQNWSGPGLNIRTKFSNGDATWESEPAVLGDGASVHSYPALVGDFDGDRRSDIAFVGQNWSGRGLNIRTKFSNGDGSYDPQSQVLGDGAGVHRFPPLVGDVDGDDRDDIVFVGQGWTAPGLHIRTKFSKGKSGWGQRQYLMSDGPGIHRHPALFGDFDGDDRSDIAFVFQGWYAPGLTIRTKFSDVNGNWTPRVDVQGDGASVHKYPTLVGDFNRDEVDDLVFVGQGWSGRGLNIRTKLSNSNGSYDPHSQVLGDGAGVHRYPTLVGDVNGDRRDDLVFVGFDLACPGLNIRVKYSSGDGTWTAEDQILQVPRDLLDKPFFLSDFTGDGKDDLLFLRQPPSGLELILLKAR